MRTKRLWFNNCKVSIALTCIACADPTSEEPVSNEEPLFNISLADEGDKRFNKSAHDDLVKRALGRQVNAAPEMVFISQAQGSTLVNYQGNYIYDDSAGVNQIVYIVDTGADLSNPVRTCLYNNEKFLLQLTSPQEFTDGDNVAQRVQWIQAGEGNDGAEDDGSVFFNPNINKNSGKGHGTAMLSKVAGHLYGVAKRVTPVLVRVPRVTTRQVATDPEGRPIITPDFPPPTAYLDGVSKALDDWRQNKQATFKTATILMSWYYLLENLPAGDAGTAFVAKLYQLISELASLGVLPVTGAGNDDLVSYQSLELA
jgi:hypothetical protein